MLPPCGASISVLWLFLQCSFYVPSVESPYNPCLFARAGEFGCKGCQAQVVRARIWPPDTAIHPWTYALCKFRCHPRATSSGVVTPVSLCLFSLLVIRTLSKQGCPNGRFRVSRFSVRPLLGLPAARAFLCSFSNGDISRADAASAFFKLDAATTCWTADGCQVFHMPTAQKAVAAVELTENRFAPFLSNEGRVSVRTPGRKCDQLVSRAA